MWIRVFPNWQINFNSKNWWKEMLFLFLLPNEENELHQCHLSQWGEWVYATQSWKEKRLLCESLFVPIEKQTFILKNDGKRSLSYETKASMSFILISKTNLWCPIIKRKKIIFWFRRCSNWLTNFDSKQWWEEELFERN